MRYQGIERRLPRRLRNHILHFEAAIERSVREFSAELPDGSLVLDAGAGEGGYAREFAKHRYVGVDLAVGDQAWDYSKLDVLSDLCHLPFATGTFDACINLVTLEHVREPGNVMKELARVLKPGGRLLLAIPQEWEVHQAPHDYFRYTRYGIRYLLERAGFRAVRVLAVGGYFRLLGRRLFNGMQFFRGIWAIPAAVLLAPPALVAPMFDGLDRDRNFTLGYICTARR